ncbi:hypothetical protein B0H21DRAFT_887942 [Amylocystis lapponica]|nr:hypothetical protein B0H21DRAFT_887942 [Amylocystis lapponica]
MAAFNVSLDDSSPLISYSPPNAWFDTPAADSFAQSYAHASLHTTNVSGASAQFTFNGTGVWLFGGHRPNYGEYYVSVDNHVVSSASASSSQPVVGQLLGGTSNLVMGEHTVTLVSTENGMIDFDSLVFETAVGSAGQSATNVTLDDTSANFTYGPSGLGWAVDNNSEWYNSTFHLSTDGGAQASLSFMGDAVAVYGAVASQLANYTVTLDGRVSQSFSGASVSKLHSQTLLYFANNLGPAQHSLVLTSSTVQDTGKFIGIDFATVYSVGGGGGGNLVVNSDAGMNGAVPPIGGPAAVSSAPSSASATSGRSTATSASTSSSSGSSFSSAASSASSSGSLSASASSASPTSNVAGSSTASSSSSAFSISAITPTSSSASATPSQSSSSSPSASSASISSSAPAGATTGIPKMTTNPSIDQADAGNNNSNISATGSDHRRSSDLSLPVVIGISVGSFAALALLLSLLACFVKHRRTQARNSKELPSPVLPMQDPDLEAGYGADAGYGEKKFADAASKRATALTSTTRWSQASYESETTLAGHGHAHAPPQEKWQMVEPVPVLPLSVRNRGERESAQSESSLGSTFVEIPMDTAALYPAWAEQRQLTPGMSVAPGTPVLPGTPAPPRPVRPPTLELSWNY